MPQQASHTMEQGCGAYVETASIATDSSGNGAFPSWENDPVQHFSPKHAQGLHFFFFFCTRFQINFFQGYSDLSQMLQVQVQQTITLVA